MIANTVVLSCFPHIVNLACKAVLSAMTSLEHAQPSAQEYVPPSQSNSDSAAMGILDAILRDPIATLRSLIRAVSRLFLLTAVGNI